MERSNPKSVERLRANGRSVTFLLPMLLRSRTAFPRARLPKHWCSTAVTLLFLPLARPKPRMKKPWRRGQPGFGRTRGEATPLVQRETLCVDGVRFIGVRVHGAEITSDERGFKGVRFSPTWSAPVSHSVPMLLVEESRQAIKAVWKKFRSLYLDAAPDGIARLIKTDRRAGTFAKINRGFDFRSRRHDTNGHSDG